VPENILQVKRQNSWTSWRKRRMWCHGTSGFIDHNEWSFSSSLLGGSEKHPGDFPQGVFGFTCHVKLPGQTTGGKKHRAFAPASSGGPDKVAERPRSQLMGQP
jgi:hypothetical protein